MKKQFLVAAFASLLSCGAFAKYGMAGCGIGALVFEDQPGKIQIVAVTLNNIISPQSSAITSGTSGCVEDGPSVASERFIETNQIALAKDVARGQGEALTGLLSLWQCDDQKAASAVLQKNYGSIFPADQAKTKASEVHNSMSKAIKSESRLACKGLA